MEARAYAKVNLSLRIGTIRADGFHSLHSVFQSIAWSDRIELERAEVDGISGWSGGPVPDDMDNLAWLAVAAVRDDVGAGQPVAVRLDKRIPVAAGLGGGSADAAAALHLACRFYNADSEVVARLAPDLGSDVPFCIVGGTALARGRGEILEPLEPVAGYALAVVVPPVELSTPQVFAAWDALGEPEGPEMAAGHLPPSLRSLGPFANDLYPAAIDIAPELDGWRSELAAGWGRPVLMSGSGSSLFAFFVDQEEADAALAVAPRGARAAEAVVPSEVGWSLVEST